MPRETRFHRKQLEELKGEHLDYVGRDARRKRMHWGHIGTQGLSNSTTDPGWGRYEKGEGFCLSKYITQMQNGADAR